MILAELGENLIKATSAREALEQLLTNDVAVMLVDVCMPELDGFELAEMVREHPRFQKTAIIFISAVHLTEVDALRGYETGAVDYVPVPVVPEVLRAKIRVFAELYRKTRQLEALNRQLEHRVAERTAELEAANARLIQSEQLRSLALAAGQMGSWDWDVARGHSTWDDGQCRIFGVDPDNFAPTRKTVLPLILEEDLPGLEASLLKRGRMPGAASEIPGAPAERRDAVLHRRRRRPAQPGGQAHQAQRRHGRHHRSEESAGTSVRSFARWIIAPRTRSRSCRRSCG